MRADLDRHSPDTAPRRSCVILVAHGSPDARWRRPFERLSRRVAGPEPGRDEVRLAYLESASPGLEYAAMAAVDDGFAHLRLLPLFMSTGRHVSRDMVEQATRIAAAHPGVQVELLRPIGEHPRFAGLLAEIVIDVAGAGAGSGATVEAPNIIDFPWRHDENRGTQAVDELAFEWLQP